MGAGGHAAVYLAQDQRLMRPVALKVLDPVRGTDPVGRARFEREYEVLARLSHPHIARCYSLERDGDLDLLVMEYVEGETLADRLLAGRMSSTEAVSLGVPLADALGACHEAGVLHRDLKPANIVLHPDRGPVILDFGVAWFSSALNLTRTGATIGTPRYMAPEVFASSLTDERADVFSLGVCLYEMVCGRSPYPVDSVAELAMGAEFPEAPQASVVVPGISRDFSAVLARAIAPEPADRYATADELRQALTRGQVLVTGTLRNSVPCESCGTPRVITLGFCPGCGTHASWLLEPGPNAVQLTGIADTERTFQWLQARYPTCLRRSAPVTRSRLNH
ncbi:MAG: serine/threonine-protein kinase, partial [Myxococcota bacterium]|nr:serine/threonine-protein kinase [Myxococcota bacterium]